MKTLATSRSRLLLLCLAFAGLFVLTPLFGQQPNGQQPPSAAPAAQPGEPPIEIPAEAREPAKENDEATDDTGETAPGGDDFERKWKPVLILLLGIAIVLGLIIGLKANAFIALITAAMVVSVLAPGDWSIKISRVASAFGGTAGGIGIVIALAAVIGKCMLDSGAADRIVRAFVGVLGEKRAPVALMGSGYVLAIPVFFDTVFYLLVPLARSLHKRTGIQYLKYILAIGAGGAITHSLVPPTPGPLLMASTLNVDLGVMIMVGALVALPAAVAGVIFGDIADRIMKTPMRPLGSEPEPKPLEDEELPALWLAVLPVLLPVAMISANTVLTTYADLEPTARFQAADVRDWNALGGALRDSSNSDALPGARRILDSLSEEGQALANKIAPLTDEDKQQFVAALNTVLAQREFYDEASFVGVAASGPTKQLLAQNPTRMRRAVQERKNRLLIEDTLNVGDEPTITPHTWETPRRMAANISDLFGNANLALLLSTIIAMWMLAKQRDLSKIEIAQVVETSLMSGGVIILITAGGGAFGAMLQAAKIGEAIQDIFGQLLQGGSSGMAYLCLGFLLASVLKVAQGSGTVAMIVGSSMMGAIVGGTDLGFNPVYLATAIGAGSLVGSWMNDSGFWIFAKMGGLTETEALKSWTLMLVVLGLVSFGVTLLLANYLPLANV